VFEEGAGGAELLLATLIFSRRNQGGRRIALRKSGSIAAISLILSLGGCGGGGGSTPTVPAPVVTPLPRLSVSVATPLQSSRVSSTATSTTFRVSANVTFRESAGTGGQITQVAGTITRQPSGQTTTANLTVALSMIGMGSVSDSYTQDFEVTGDVESVTWRLSASGIDPQGRLFSASSADVTVEPPVVQPPPVPTAARYELWGGRDYEVFLGCFSCNRFASDSVFNEFGRYGSRYSPTSVTSRFSRYGSEFSSDSACNQFASNPPIILNTANRTYTELTLNQFRRLADPTVLSVLRTYICVS